MWLELLQCFLRVVDERETSRLAATILSSEAEDCDLVSVGLVELGELGAKFVFRDIGTAGVEDITTAPNPRVRCRIECGISASHPLI